MNSEDQQQLNADRAEFLVLFSDWMLGMPWIILGVHALRNRAQH